MSAPLRLAVISVVGVLGVGIGLVAGTFMLGPRTAALGAASSYVPATAPLYLELRLEPSPEQDAALRSFVGHFPVEEIDLERPLYAQLVELIDDVLLEEGVDVSWSTDVAPWFDGHVAVAVLELPAALFDPAADPMEAPEPPVVVLVGVTDRAAAEAAINRLLAEAGSDVPAFETETYRGVTINTDPGGEGAWALTDDQLIAGADASAIRTALDARQDGPTVADGAAADELAGRLPDDWLAFFSYDMTEMVRGAATAMESESPEMAAAFEEILAGQSLRGAATVSAAGDRIVVDGAAEAPSGAFAVKNADRGLADEVPGDALYYAEGGNIGAALEGIIGPAKAGAASDPRGAEELRTLEAALGTDLEEVVRWIGDGALVIGVDAGEPYAGAVIVPTDMDAAERRLSQLVSFATLAALDPSTGISVSEADASGVTVTTIRWDSAGPEPDLLLPTPTGVVLEVAVTDERVLIGAGDRFVRRALDLGEGETLADQPRFADAIDELGGAEHAGATWIDLAGAVTAIEDAATDLGALDGAGSYATELRPWLAPLDRLVSVSRLEGDVLVHRAVLSVE